MAYNQTATLTAGLRPANNRNFPIVQAPDVFIDDNTRLDAALENVVERVYKTASGDVVLVEAPDEGIYNGCPVFVDGDDALYLEQVGNVLKWELDYDGNTYYSASGAEGTLPENITLTDASDSTSSITLAYEMRAKVKKQDLAAAVTGKLDSSAAAPAFEVRTDQHPYQHGELVSKDGKIYQCDDASFSGEWSESSWVAQPVSKLFLGKNGNQTLNGTLTLGNTRIEEDKIVCDIGAAGESHLKFPAGADEFLAVLSDTMRFSDTVTYDVNAVVFSNGSFWQCTTKHSAGAWKDSHFTKIFDIATDVAPTANSTKLLTSGAISTALGGKVSKSGDTMTGGLTVPNLTVGTRAAGSAVGTNSVAEGNGNTASGPCSHAEGIGTTASGFYSHAEGDGTTASSDGSHAEGDGTTASGPYSHAEGAGTTASGPYSHAEGFGTTAQNDFEHAQGRYNASHTGSTDQEKTLSSIGFGTTGNNRKNAVETMQDGKTYIYGLGGYDGTNPTEIGVKDLATVVNESETKVVEYRLPDDCFPITYTDLMLPSGQQSCTIASNDGIRFEFDSGFNAVRLHDIASEAAGGYPSGFGWFSASTLKWNGSDAPIQNLKFNNTVPTDSAWPVLEKDAVFVRDVEVAKVASPAFTGAPTAITPEVGDNSTRIATTEFVNGAIAAADVSLQVRTSWADLKAKRDGGTLVPGQQYRITDYVTTARPYHDDGTFFYRSAGHQFDLIVSAESTTTLSEIAKAIPHDGSLPDDRVWVYSPEEGEKIVPYFSLANMAAWQVWYRLDNDYDSFQWAVEAYIKIGSDYYFRQAEEDATSGTYRYAWNDGSSTRYTQTDNPSVSADKAYSSTSGGTDYTIVEAVFGRGVIYRMIDEFGNDCPYDFKNIQFARWNVSSISSDKLSPSSVADLTARFCGNNNGGEYVAADNGGTSFYGTKLNVDAVSTDSAKWYYTFGAAKDTFKIKANDKIYERTPASDATNASYPFAWKSETNDILYTNVTYAAGGNYAYSSSEGGDSYEISVFNWCPADYSLAGDSFYIQDNVILPNYWDFFTLNPLTQQVLNNIVLIGTEVYSNVFGIGCLGITMVGKPNDILFATRTLQFYENKIGNASFMLLGASYINRSSFGEYCANMLVGEGFFGGKVGNGCTQMTFGKNCAGISIGDSSHLIAMGSGSMYNSFGPECAYIIMGDQCINCSFGFGCQNVIFGAFPDGEDISSPPTGFDPNKSYTVGAYVRYNYRYYRCTTAHAGAWADSHFSLVNLTNTLNSNYWNVEIGANNGSLILHCTAPMDPSDDKYRNVTVCKGVNNTSTYKTIVDSNKNQTWLTTYKPKNSEEIEI